jgi:hypothetical protein
MKKHLIEDLNRINTLMGVKTKTINESTDNVRKLLNEGGRDDIFTKFFNVFFGDAGSKLLKNADEGFALLKKQSDELVTAGKITRTEVDEAMVLIKKHIDELKNADSLKIVDNLPSETARNRYLVKNFLEKIDPTTISNMRKEIIKKLRDSEDYLEWAFYFEDSIFKSAIFKYEKELKAGTTWQITKEDFKKGLPEKFKKLDVHGAFKDAPEMYDDMAEYLDTRVDAFFEGKIPEYDSKFLLKQTPQEVFVNLTSDVSKLEGLSDEQIDYLNKVYETKNGTLGTFKVWFDELHKKLKGNQQTYSEKLQTLLQSVETLRDPNIDLLTKRRIANEMSEIFNGLEKLDLDLKFAVEDFINLRLNADELKTFKDLLLGLDLETKTSKLVEKSIWPEWSIWVKDAFKQRMSASMALLKAPFYYKSLASSMIKDLKSGSIFKIIERVGGEKTVGDQAREFFWRGTALNRGDYKSWASYLPMGLEFAGELTNLMFRRNKKQVIKRLTQLGTQYAYAYIQYSLLYCFTNTVVEAFSSFLITHGYVDKNKENPMFIQSLIIDQAQQYNDKLSKIIGNQTITSKDQPKNDVDRAFEGAWRAFNYIMNNMSPAFSQNISLLSGFPGGMDNLLGLCKYLFPSESEAELKIKKKNIEKNQEKTLIKLEGGGYVEPPTVKKEDSYENLQVVIMSNGYDVTKYSDKLFQVGQEHINKIGFPIYWMEGIKGNQYFGQTMYEDGKVVIRFTPNSNYEKIQVMIVSRGVWDSSKVYPTLKNDSDWKDVPIITSSEEFVRNTAQEVKQKIPENNIKKIIKNILSSNMEIRKRRIFEQEDEKRFGENKYDHLYDAFTFEKYDDKTGEFKEIETDSLKHGKIKERFNDFIKRYDTDDAFVRAVVDTHEDIARIKYLKDQANISEAYLATGLALVLNSIRESKGEYEIFSVSRSNGNWHLVKGDFNQKEMSKMKLTKQIPPEKQPKKKENGVESLKKKELTGITLLNQDEKKGLVELPNQIKRKVLEKLRSGWVTEKPYEFLKEFYSVSDINSVFNDKIKIYKLNPTKEFFESLAQNSPRVFIRKGFCKSLNVIKNTKISSESGEKVFKHILDKCQTKFKGEYGVTQINKYL